MSILGVDVALPAVLLGLLTGSTYGLLAVGLVLVHRTSRVVNFAHGALGVLAAAILAVAVTRWHVPYWVAFPGALALGAALGAGSHVAVVRRLRKAPSLMTVVATLGLAELFAALAAVVHAEAGLGALFPQPTGLPQVQVGALLLTRAHLAILVLSPLVVAAVAVLLSRTHVGTAIRASAVNPDLARTLRISPMRTSAVAWAIAGGISAFTAILVLPTVPFVPEFFGLGLLVRALVAAVVARMHSLTVAFLAGIGVGVVEQVLTWNVSRAGIVELVLFVLLMVGLLLQPRLLGRREERGSWMRLDIRLSPALRRRMWPLAIAGMATAVGFVALSTNVAAVDLTVVIAYAVVGLSLGIVTGLGGQLSLGHWALAGVGGTASVLVTTSTGNFFLGFAAAGVAAAVTAMLVAAPAVRIRGPMLAVTTLGFALMAQAWLFQQPWMLGPGRRPGRPIVGTWVLDSGRDYAFLALVLLVIAVAIARLVWRGGLGRRLVAIRDGEEAARAFGVPATRTILTAFASSGFVAGMGGALYAHLLPSVSGSAFPIDASIRVVALVALGGVGLLAGPLLGALYIVGVPLIVPLDSAGLAATSLGWLILILYFPGGLARLLPQAPAPGRSAQVPVAPAAPRAAVQVARDAPGPALEVREVHVAFSGVRALAGVSLTVNRGEIVGIVGPNGAGKTTLLDVISGFVRPSAGRITLLGRDATAWAVERRARRGLARSFQDAPLFPTMTVIETMRLAQEVRERSSRPGVRGAERQAEAMVARFGLSTLREARIAELSSGTRRVVELACVTQLEPAVALLDEPSSGLAEAEVAQLAGLLLRLREETGCALILVEHHLPLVREVADRVVSMQAGTIAGETAHAPMQPG